MKENFFGNLLINAGITWGSMWEDPEVHGGSTSSGISGMSPVRMRQKPLNNSPTPSAITTNQKASNTA